MLRSTPTVKKPETEAGKQPTTKKKHFCIAKCNMQRKNKNFMVSIRRGWLIVRAESFEATCEKGVLVKHAGRFRNLLLNVVLLFSCSAKGDSCCMITAFSAFLLSDAHVTHSAHFSTFYGCKLRGKSHSIQAPDADLSCLCKTDYHFQYHNLTYLHLVGMLSVHWDENLV